MELLWFTRKFLTTCGIPVQSVLQAVRSWDCGSTSPYCSLTSRCLTALTSRCWPSQQDPWNKTFLQAHNHNQSYSFAPTWQNLAKDTFPVTWEWKNAKDVFSMHRFKFFSFQVSSLFSLLTLDATSVLQAGDVGLQGWLSVPFQISGTGAQLFAEILLDHAHVFWI